jgi:uncharacterized protein YjbI with pentapeptide repeats
MIALTLAAVLGLPATCTGCDFAGRDLRGADLANVTFVGVDFARSDLRDLRGVLVCRSGHEPRTCEPVGAATLKRASHSELDGAIL